MTKQELAQKRKDKEKFYAYNGLDIIEISPCEVENIIILSNTIEVIWADFYVDYYKYDDIFNTRAQAQHYLDNSNVTRTEKLPYVTWEEFKKKGNFTFFGIKNKEYDLYTRYGTNDKPHKIILEQWCDYDYIPPFVEYDYSEENFYKAYDVCRKLFLGKEV